MGFIMEHEQMTYVEALRWLAKKYHIEIKEREQTSEERQQESERESMFILNEWVAKYYHDILQNNADANGRITTRKVYQMEKYVINGGKPLQGEVDISGAKNAAVAIIPAALMVDGVCRIENMPQISDTDMLLTILTHLGAEVKLINESTIEIDSRNVKFSDAPFDLMRKIRASYYLIGAMLSRFGSAKTTMPGGCNFGVRPIDQHIKGMTALGADIEVKNGFVYAEAPDGRLHGAKIYLDKVSVGATMNIILAATLASGRTIIENAAREPHIVDLANFLNSMGADIRGAGTDTIKVNGVDRLHGGSSRDRAGSICISP